MKTRTIWNDWIGTSSDEEFIRRYPFAVSITMKQSRWDKDINDVVFLDRSRASENLKHFRHKLNDALFGRRWSDRGDGIKVIAAFHGLNSSVKLGNDNRWWNSKYDGSTRKPSRMTSHIHYHASFSSELATHERGTLLSSKRTDEQIKDLLIEIHNKTLFGSGIDQIEVVQMRSRGWIGYCTNPSELSANDEFFDNIDSDNGNFNP